MQRPETMSIVVSVDITKMTASQLVAIMQSSRNAKKFSRPVPLNALLGALKSKPAASSASNSDSGRGLTCEQLRALLPPLAKGEPAVRVATPSISNGLFVPSNSLRVPVGSKVAQTRSHIKSPVIAAPTAADASASNKLATELHAHRQELLVSDHTKQPTLRTSAATCDESQSMHYEPLAAVRYSSSSLSPSVFDRSSSTEEVPERMAPNSHLAYRFVNALRRISLPREFASRGATKPQLANGGTRPSLCLTCRT